MSVGWGINILSNRRSNMGNQIRTFPKHLFAGDQTMSAIALNSATFSHPSRSRLNQRARLTRSLVVLSLAIVLGAGFAMKAGAGDSLNSSKAPSFTTITVAPGDTLWSIASAASHGGDVRGMAEEIISVNSLSVPDVKAGQSLRIPA